MQNAPSLLLLLLQIIPDYSWLFLIIPNNSRDTTIPIIADYSNYFLIIQIIRIIPIIAKICLPHVEIESIVCLSCH